MSEAAVARAGDDRSPLRRALDALPHAEAEDYERRLVDAVDRFLRTNDASDLNRLVLAIGVGARLESNPEFREALAWSDAHPEPIPTPLDHEAVVTRLRA